MTRKMVNHPSGRDLCLRAHQSRCRLSQRTVLGHDLQNTEPDIAAQEMTSRSKARQHPSQIKPANAKDATAMSQRQIRQLQLSSRDDHEMLVQMRNEILAESDVNIVHPKEVERETHLLPAEVADISRKV